jgi:glyoxylase-like metal-dependent hydrolase (beta-lactamase superfamily II)
MVASQKLRFMVGLKPTINNSLNTEEDALPQIDLVLEGWSVNLDQGRAAFCGVTLIRGTKNILVDVAHVGRRSLLVESLGRLGLQPSDIDTVVLTHSHWDHILNADVFKNAEFLLHPWEVEYAKSPHPGDWATPDYTWTILERCRIREVQEGAEIDDGVRVILTPGHTRGSISLVVQQNNGPVVVCGDALPTARTALDECPYLVFWDVDDARRSARKILDSGEVLYPGHDRPFRIAGGQVAYIDPPRSLQITAGLDETGPPISVQLAAGEARPVQIEGLAVERQSARK